MNSFAPKAQGWLAAVSLLCMLGSSLSLAADTAKPKAKTAATLSRPDFNGVWHRQGFARGVNDVSFMMPWVAQEVIRRQQASKRGEPIATAYTKCRLIGPLGMWFDAHSLQIIQTPDALIFLGETDHQVRHVYFNASHPANLLPTWLGHSVGQWQGETLVIDTVGFNDQTELDSSGTPHSAALHVVERLRPLDNGKSLEVKITIEDPLALKQPWLITHQMVKQDDKKFVPEYACAENNKDA